MQARFFIVINIPQSNPGANYFAHQTEIDAAVQRVLHGGWYILGAETAAFEQEFAAYIGAAHAVGVGSGTDALCLALRAAGVGSGQLVATVSHTAVATVAAIEMCGATPLLIDIDPATYTMDAGQLQECLQQNSVRAVVPVHLYGRPADLGVIAALTAQHGALLVEDCSQAHGAALDGRKLGSWGHAAAFSFYPTKNLGAMGDGGMVATSDAGLAERVRSLREYGWRERYVSETAGVNSRLDEMQAAVLRVKLRHLDVENDCRRALACHYQGLLANSGFGLPPSSAGWHVYHQYVVRSKQRDALRAGLATAGIKTLVHYPVPVHLQPAYAGRVRVQRTLPHTEAAAREIMSLPMFPELTFADVESVAAQLVALGQAYP